jgi:hypothetical protein
MSIIVRNVISMFVLYLKKIVYFLLNKLVKFPKVRNASDSAFFFWFAMMHKGNSHLDLSVEHSNVTEMLKLVFEDLLMMFRNWAQSTTEQHSAGS